MTPRPRSRHRELTDFLAFALAIVFLVRTFVGEPYGIPTGSMAPTLLGAHKLIRCLACRKEFPVGVLEGSPPVVCRCPACETTLDIADAPIKSGNRIIVLKGPPKPLKRWDVAVFKFIDEPRKLYVKRIVGLPGERLRIKAGEIEIWNEDEQRWRIARKPAELAKELAIPVWERKDQVEGRPEVWTATPANSWVKMDDGWTSNGLGELAFRNLAPIGRPFLIGHDLPYNLGLSSTQAANAESYWNKASCPVGDLHVDFVVHSLGSPDLRIDVHLRRGSHVFELRIGHPNWGTYVDGRLLQETRPFDLADRLHVRFALVDRQLLVWRNHELVGDARIADDLIDDDPTASDLEPIHFSASDTRARLVNLRVLRDVYYTQDVGLTDFIPNDSGRDLMGDVSQFKRFRDGRKRTKEFTIGPNQYFALGDNSDQSLDGRHWKHGHFVDERMIVGRVMFKLGR